MASMIQRPAAKTKPSSCSSTTDDELKNADNKGTAVMNTTLSKKETQSKVAAAAAEAACLNNAILELNETGIELFRRQRTLFKTDGKAGNKNGDKDHPRRSLETFQQAASKLAECLLLASAQAQASKITDMLRQMDTTNNEATLTTQNNHPILSCESNVMERVSQSSHQTHHDYEQTDFISLKGLPIDIPTASTVVLHNLGLVMLAMKVINLGPLKLCLELSKEVNGSGQSCCQVILSQVEASANYLMGLTLYKKSCTTVSLIIDQDENKEVESSKDEAKTSNTEGSSKRRKLMVQEENNNNKDSSDTKRVHHQHQQNRRMMLLYKSLEYVLDGLGAMNEYQSHLMMMASTNTFGSKQNVDTTSIPIGLFYILGQVYLRLNMRRDAQQAFQRCTWFVQSRQHQLVADEMLMRAGGIKRDATDASITKEGSADVVSSSMNKNNKTKESPLTRNAAAA